MSWLNPLQHIVEGKTIKTQWQYSLIYMHFLKNKLSLTPFCVEMCKDSFFYNFFYIHNQCNVASRASRVAVFPLAFIVLLIISLYTSTIPNLLCNCVFLFAPLTDAYLLFYNIFCLLQCKLVTIYLIISLYTTHIKQSVFIHVMDSHHHISS